MLTAVYRLTFTAPFHLGGKGNAHYQDSDYFIHSDTLSAAILLAWAEIDSSIASDSFENPPFLLSSAFPYFEQFYFLPRPLNSYALNLTKAQLPLANLLKKINWLDFDLWQQLIAQPNQWPANFYYLPKNQLAISENAAQVIIEQHQTPLSHFQLWATEELARAPVERLTGKALTEQAFQLARIYYAPQGGLYFIARFNDEQTKQNFASALTWLGDSGIGAGRSNGQGTFTWTEGHLLLPAPQPEQPAIALSLVTPAPEEAQTPWLTGASYELINRSGWISGSKQRKPTLRCIREGSYFPRPLTGKMVSLGTHPNKGHPIFRDGRGFWVNCEFL